MRILALASVLVAVVVPVAAADAATAIAQATTSYTVAAHASTDTVLAGATYRINGSISPSAPGAIVVLQRRYAGTWHAVKVKTATENSRFTFRLTAPARYGPRVFRVKKRATSTAQAAFSAKISVLVVNPGY